jgi:hypothetical protein
MAPDQDERGERVVVQPHDSVCVAEGALQLAGEQRHRAFLDSAAGIEFPEMGTDRQNLCGRRRSY